MTDKQQYASPACATCPHMRIDATNSHNSMCTLPANYSKVYEKILEWRGEAPPKSCPLSAFRTAPLSRKQQMLRLFPRS